MLPVLRVVQFFSLFSMAGTQKSSPMASNGYLNTNGLSSFNNVLNGLGGVNTNNNPNTNRNMNSNMASNFNTNNNDNFNNFLSRYNNNVNRNLNMNNAVLSRNPALLTSRNYNNNLGSTFPAVNNNNVNTNNNNIGLSTAPQSSFNNNVPGISAVPQASLGLTAAPQSGYNPFSDFTASLAQRKEVQVEVPPLANVQPQFSPLKATLFFFDCQVTGDPPIKVTWLKEGLPLDVANQARYVVLPDQGTGSNRLLVTGATEADVGRYDCQASNTFGTHLDTAYVYKDEKAVTCD